MDRDRTDGERGVKRLRGAIAIIALSMILIGQTMLFTEPIKQDIGIPASFWLSLAGIFILVIGLALRPPKFLVTFFDRLPLDGAVPWVLAAVLLSALAAFSMVQFQKVARINYGPVIMLWFASIGCYITAFSKGIPRIHVKTWWKENRTEILLAGGMTLLAFLVRFYRLGDIPRVINGDEGLIGLAAQSTSQGQMANPFALFENFGGLYLLAINTLFSLLGTSIFSLRLLPAAGGVLAIPAVYLLSREIAGKRVALISAALLAFSHAHIHFSRTAAVAYIQGTWLVPLELYFLLSGLKNRSAWRTAIGGCLLAVHFSIYLSAQIVVGILIVYLVLSLILFRTWIKTAARQVFVFWGGFLIALLPEAVFASQNTSEFFARLNADGTFQSGWLEQTMSLTGKGAVQILAERVIHAFLSLIYYPAFDFYGSPVPILTLVGAALFLIGMGIAIWRFRSPEYLLLNCYFWGFTFAIGIFALPPTADSYRMLAALPAALIMAAAALDQILHLVGLGWSTSRPAYAAITLFTIASLGFYNLWVYYGDFAGRCMYADSTVTRFASYLGSYARKVGAEDTVYLLSDDLYRYGTHASVDFLSGRHPIINLMESIDTLKTSPGEVIIANPNRFDELRNWVKSNPGGEMKYIYDCTNLIMITYSIPQR